MSKTSKRMTSVEVAPRHQIPRRKSERIDQSSIGYYKQNTIDIMMIGDNQENDISLLFELK